MSVECDNCHGAGRVSVGSMESGDYYSPPLEICDDCDVCEGKGVLCDVCGLAVDDICDACAAPVCADCLQDRACCEPERTR